MIAELPKRNYLVYLRLVIRLSIMLLLPIFFIFTAWAEFNITEIATGEYWMEGLCVGDGDNDGVFEIYSSNRSGLYQFRRSETAWINTSMGNVMWSVTVGDGDNDGKQEVYGASHDGHIYQFKWNGSSWIKTDVGCGGWGMSEVSIGDGDNDGKLELYGANLDDHIYQFKWDGNSWTKTNVGSGGRFIFGYSGSMRSVCVSDGDNDGKMEVYGSNSDNYVYKFEWNGNSWTKTEVGYGEGSINEVVVGDGDNDANSEVYAGDDSGSLYQFRFINSMWTKTKIDSGRSGMRSIAIGDGGNSGKVEIYAACYDDPLYQFSFSGSSWTKTAIGSLEKYDILGIAIGDGDNDNKLEIYGTAWDQHLYQFKFETIILPPPDTTPPEPPGDISITNTGRGEELFISWINPPENDFSHVRIYRSTCAGVRGGLVYDNVLGITTYDRGLNNATSYYYSLTSLDLEGNESAPLSMKPSLTPFFCSEVTDMRTNLSTDKICDSGINAFWKEEDNYEYGGAKSYGGILKDGTYEDRNGPGSGALIISWSGTMSEQSLTVTTDAGIIDVYLPKATLYGQGEGFFVATDGSTYWTDINHNGTGDDRMRPFDAVQPEHLARAMPDNNGQYRGIPYDTTPPKPVQNFRYNVSKDAKVTLGWETSISSDVYKYNVYWDSGTGGINYSKIMAVISHPVNNWSSDIIPDGTYKFAIRTEDKSNNEEKNVNISINIIINCTPPAQPTDISVNATGKTGELLVSWTNPTDKDFSHIHIYRSTNQGILGNLVYDNVLGSNFLDKGLINNTSYYYVIHSVDAVGNETTNNEQYAGVPQDLTPPAPPENISAFVISINTVLLTWTSSNSEDIFGYNIYWDNGTGIIDYSKPLASLLHPATVWVSNPLDNGQYHFAVCSQDKYGNEDKIDGETIDINIIYLPFSDDKDLPSLEVISPKDTVRYSSSLPLIYGTACDKSSDIKSVGLCIQDLDNGKYWNGKQWVFEKTFVTAEGTDKWLYATPFAEHGYPYRYTFYVRAVDKSDNEFVSKEIRYSVNIENAETKDEWSVNQQNDNIVLTLNNLTPGVTYYRLYYIGYDVVCSDWFGYSEILRPQERNSITSKSPQKNETINIFIKPVFQARPEKEQLIELPTRENPGHIPPVLPPSSYTVITIGEPAVTETEQGISTPTISNTVIDTDTKQVSSQIPVEPSPSSPKLPTMVWKTNGDSANYSEMYPVKVIPEPSRDLRVVTYPTEIIIKKDTEFELRLPYRDINQDGIVDGTDIPETSLIILMYSELSKTWIGGFKTTVNTEENVCTARVSESGIYAIFSPYKILPAPVRNLSANVVNKNCVKLNWIPSASLSEGFYNTYYANGNYYIQQYEIKHRIYWDNGTGVIDYANSPGLVGQLTNTWTSGQLKPGTYKFAVRVIDREGNEEKNTDFVTGTIEASDVPTSSGEKPIPQARVIIKVPRDGKKISGNAVTVIAEPVEISPVTGVVFQYRHAFSNEWINITGRDSKPPYAVYWNVSGLANGQYCLRAVAYDNNNLSDPEPEFITVYIDDVNADIVEDGNPEVDPNKPHRKEEKIDESVKNDEQEVLVADGTGAIIPTGAAKNDRLIISEIKEPEASAGLSYLSVGLSYLSDKLPHIETSLEPAGVYREFEFTSGAKKFSEDITIMLPYKDENDDGIVDDKNIPVDKLKIYYYDETKDKWKEVENPSPGDKNNIKTRNTKSSGSKVITAKVNHFTLFGLFANVPRNNLDNVIVYPNPFVPSDGHEYIRFDNLTEKTKINIFTLSGKLVKSMESTESFCDWFADNDDGQKVSSGVYFYLIVGNGSNTKGKLAIVR